MKFQFNNFLYIFMIIEWEDAKVEHQWQDTWEDDINEDDFYTQLMYFLLFYNIYYFFFIFHFFLSIIY